MLVAVCRCLFCEVYSLVRYGYNLLDVFDGDYLLFERDFWCLCLNVYSFEL